jgi:hypothetical protein
MGILKTVESRNYGSDHLIQASRRVEPTKLGRILGVRSELRAMVGNRWLTVRSLGEPVGDGDSGHLSPIDVA